MKKKIIAIVANGEPIETEYLKTFFRDVEIVIAADGGTQSCKNVQITPDYIIGDLDSVQQDHLESFPGSEVITMPDQNSTDMEKALNFALKLNPARIKIFAAFGKRTDHSMSNIILFHNLDSETELQIFDNYGYLRLLKPGVTNIQADINRTVSLFSFQPIKNLNLYGFKYPLINHSSQKPFFGISNIYESENCRIEFEEGKLFLYEVFD